MKRFTVRYITITGVLIAISVLLASSLCTFYITPAIRISFRDLPIILASLYCGPIAGLIAGVAADLIGTTMSGLGWYPLITISAALVGVIPGLVKWLFFKRRSYSFAAVAVGVFACNIIANMGWTTLSLNWLYGMEIPLLLSTRIPLYIILACVEAYAIFALLGVLRKIYPPAPEIMTYDETLNYIHTINWRGSKLGLDRIQELLKLLHNPEKNLKFVHIAGTNGKGSTAAMTASVLRAQGYKVGLFVSPFVTVFNERMQINGENIPNEKLAELVSTIKPYAEGMKVLPTEFELITATAFTYFYKEQCDIVVLEVGLGGELDSTNVITTSEVSVITAIGLDHTKILGDSIEDIAKAKAGIIKDNSPVVFCGEDVRALPIIQQACTAHNSTCIRPDFSRLEAKDRSVLGQSFDYKSYSNLWIPLVGIYQLNNAAVVIETIETLREKGWNISNDALYLGLHNTKWPARFEVLQQDPLFIVDGGHNPMGVESTMGTCASLFGNKKLILIMGVMADKDVDTMLKFILPQTESVFTVTPDNHRALSALDLAEKIKAEGVSATPYGTIKDAVEAAFKKAQKDDIILAVGSLYMAGEIRQLVLQRNVEVEDVDGFNG